MEDLRNSILTAQNKNRNVHGQCFVSDDDLRDVLTEDAVRKALRDRETTTDCKLEPFHIDQAVNVVVHGAHRIFAILVHIRHTKSILQFIEGDNYQSSGLDHRLPFEKGQLHAIFPAPTTVDEFYERQWHFTAPIFCDSIVTRILPPEIILPIIEEESLGAGGFGEVYSIKIASSHQRFDSVSRSQQEVSQTRPAGLPKLLINIPASTEGVPATGRQSVRLRDRASQPLDFEASSPSEHH
jgi:hypothetical protein